MVTFVRAQLLDQICHLWENGKIRFVEGDGDLFPGEIIRHPRRVVGERSADDTMNCVALLMKKLS